MNRSNYRKYSRSRAIIELRELAGRSHLIIAQEGWQETLRAAVRLVKEGGAEMIKVDNAPANLDAVKAIAHAGIPVYPQFGFTPQSSLTSPMVK